MSINTPGAFSSPDLISDHLSPKAQSILNKLGRNEFLWANIAELESEMSKLHHKLLKTTTLNRLKN